MMKVSASQRILAAVASIAVTLGAAKGVTELARHEPGIRGVTRANAPQAGVVCAPVGAPRDMPGAGPGSRTGA